MLLPPPPPKVSAAEFSRFVIPEIRLLPQMLADYKCHITKPPKRPARSPYFYLPILVCILNITNIAAHQLSSQAVGRERPSKAPKPSFSLSDFADFPFLPKYQANGLEKERERALVFGSLLSSQMLVCADFLTVGICGL